MHLMKVLVTLSCPTLCNPLDCSLSGSSVHGIHSPGKNPGMVSHSLLQGIFPTQRLNPSLPHCRQILYHLSHQGSGHVCVCYKSAVTPVTKDSSSKYPKNVHLHPHKAFEICSTLYSKAKTVIICLM